MAKRRQGILTAMKFRRVIPLVICGYIRRSGDGVWSSAMGRNPEFAALAEAIEAERNAKHITQGQLGKLVAEIEGRAKPYTQGDVADWETRDRAARKPHLIFAIEEALELRPGTLSQHLGFLPLTAVPALSVEDAIAVDKRLTPSERRLALRQYVAIFEGR